MCKNMWLGSIDTKLQMVTKCSAKCILDWPWSGRSLPKGNQWECWDPRLGPNVFRLPVHLPPNIWPTQSLTGWYLVTWLVGWPIAAGKLALLAGWLPMKLNVNMTLPATTCLTNSKPDGLISCHMVGWLTNCSWLAGWLPIAQNVNLILPPERYMLWSCVWLFWSQRPVVRCNPPK